MANRQDTQTLHLQMIDDCEKRQDRLTEWEQGFIDSVSKWIATYPLTPKQAETLERVWEKATERG